MGILGRPEGVFDLSNSDKYVGSYLTKSDVKEILNISDSYSGPYWATILADTGPPFWSIPGHFIK
ncbi:hypothetical protein U5907_07005 [Bacteroidales bacterium MB20-C3-3]|nr:hypothetical protein U5907_07005 [Bacteroidales bacterium MB20-C3-3]